MTSRRAAFVGLALVVAALGSVQVRAAGDPAEAATARKLAAIRNQPLALEAFLRQMPKGGDLHNHLSGSIYAESYMRWAARRPALRRRRDVYAGAGSMRRRRRQAGRQAR